MDETLTELKIPTFEYIKDQCPPWEKEELFAFFNEPYRKQVIFFAEKIEPVEIALVLVALQKGFEVFFSYGEKNESSQHAQQRLTQCSAFILSREQLIAELYYFRT